MTRPIGELAWRSEKGMKYPGWNSNFQVEEAFGCDVSIIKILRQVCGNVTSHDAQLRPLYWVGRLTVDVVLQICPAIP